MSQPTDRRGRSLATALVGVSLSLCVFAVGGRGALAAELHAPAGTSKVVFYDGKDRPIEALEDKDGDGRYETRTFFADGAPQRQEVDRDGDGKPERVQTWDAQGRDESLSVDSNGDGRMDRWQHYKAGRLNEVDEDRNGDGRVDVKGHYEGTGKMTWIEQDEDGDGVFEAIQRFDRPPWTRVVTLTGKRADGGRLTLYYRGDHMVQREADVDNDGHLDWREIFDNNGTRRERCAFVSDGKRLEGLCPVHIFYDGQGRVPVRAERDEDGDGRPEVWFFYQDGRLARVEEDTNRDGKADVWEKYGPDGQVVKVERDVDGDGRPDGSE